MKFTVKELKKEVMKVKKKFKVSKLNHKYYITRYITNLLNELDEKAVGTQTPQFVHEKYTDVTIQKDKSRYVLCSKDWCAMSTINRKDVGDLLYKLII